MGGLDNRISTVTLKQYSNIHGDGKKLGAYNKISLSQTYITRNSKQTASS